MSHCYSTGFQATLELEQCHYESWGPLSASRAYALASVCLKWHYSPQRLLLLMASKSIMTLIHEMVTGAVMNTQTKMHMQR